MIQPGDFIQEEMNYRGWTTEDLEEKSQLQAIGLKEIIAHNRRITPVFALGLAKAFGTSKDFWMNLQNNYDAPTDISIFCPEGYPIEGKDTGNQRQ